MLEIDQVIRQAHSLEPLPASAAKLAGLVASAEPDLPAIAGVVESDPALTAALLRRANSAASGANRSIATVRDAVTRLGAAGVLQVVTRAAARPMLNQALPEYGLRAGKLWEHSRTTAIAVDLIGKLTRRRLPPEATTTALLHDIGKLVLARFLSEEIRDLLDRSFAVHHNYRLAESEVLGVSQAELGGLLAERWQLPVSIVQSITHCQAPSDYANQLGAKEPILTICHSVHFANFLAKCSDTNQEEKLAQGGALASERTASTSAFSADVLASIEYLGIDPARFAELFASLLAAVAKSED